MGACSGRGEFGRELIDEIKGSGPRHGRLRITQGWMGGWSVANTEAVSYRNSAGKRAPWELQRDTGMAGES